jgi:uncharacterized membrane protein YczE
MNTLIFVLAIYGICNIMIFSSIFSGFRDFISKFGTGPYSIHKLFNCMMCLPFWVGVVISLSLILLGFGQLSPFYNAGITNIPLAVFLTGVFSSSTTWLIHTLQEYFERGNK